MKKFYVCMLASEKNGTLYIGVTSDLVKRVWQLHISCSITLQQWDWESQDKKETGLTYLLLRYVF